MKYINCLKKKSGFTMIELLVVIAVVGILLAIVAPAFRSEERAIRQANEKARNFYYTVQSVMTDIKLSKNTDIKFDDTPASVDNVIVIEVRKTAGAARTAAPVAGDVSLPANLGVNFEGGSFTAFGDYVLGKLGTFLDGGGEIAEYFYFTVDKDYRVLAAYYTWGQVPLNLPTHDTFNLTNRVNGVMVGAFPLERGGLGETIPA